MADDKVSVEISIEERAALKALTALTKGVDKFEKETTKSIRKVDSRFDVFVGNLQANLATAAISKVTGAFLDLATGAVDAAANYESLQRRLEVLTGSASVASDTFKELTDFAAKTPFAITEITEATTQLLAFGFSVDESLEKMQVLGDVSAGSGKNLKELTTIFGQVAGQGKLTAERLNQLNEAAIPIDTELAKVLGVAKSEVRSLVTQGVVGFKEFETAFKNLTAEGGLFAGSLEKQSATLNGSISNLEDSFTNLQAEIGRAFSPAIIAGANKLSEVMEDLKPTVTDVADTFGALTNWLTSDEGVASARAEIQALEATMKDVKNTTDRVNSVLGEDSWLGKINRSRADERIKNIKAEIEELTKSLMKQGIDVESEKQAAEQQAEAERNKAEKRVSNEQTTNLKILEERRKLQDQLLLLEQDAQIKAAERELAQQEITQERREVLLNDVADYEAEKIEIAYQAELEKNRKIRDAETKALADRAASAKKEIALKQNQAKVEQTIQQTRVQNEQKMVQGFGVAFAQAASIAKKGTAEQKLFATAAATINTYAAATRAFRDYPYPANIAVLATTIATGLKQVQEINKVSFATGGVVGGMAGASMGNDNTTANVRTGEMILNANQQRRLFDIATGEETTPRQPQMIEVTSIVQVDEREIARAVRNQRLEGFAI